MVRVRGSVGMRATTATCDWCESSRGYSSRPATATPNSNSGSGDGKGARELAPWHEQRTGTTCDGAGAWISRQARHDRDMRLVRLIARPSHAALLLCATANPTSNSGSGDSEGASELAPWRKHRIGTTRDGAGAWISRHARRDREMRLVRLVVTAPALCHTHC